MDTAITNGIISGIIIGLIIGLPYCIIKLIIYFKCGKEIKLFSGLSLFAIILGLIYGFKGED